MGNLSIQPNKGIQPSTGDLSTVRMQLSAKDNSKSSIDQKSTGCFSSLWNSFVSALSSIWNFFTGCCTSKEKGTSTEKPSEKKKIETEEEVEKPNLTAAIIKNHLNNFAEIVYPKIGEIEKRVSDQPNVSLESVWWVEYPGTKEMISTSTLDSIGSKSKHDPRNAGICKVATKDASSFYLHALLVVKNSADQTYQVHRFVNKSSIVESSNEFEMGQLGTFDRKINNFSEAKEYISNILRVDGSDQELLAALSVCFMFRK